MSGKIGGEMMMNCSKLIDRYMRVLLEGTT